MSLQGVLRVSLVRLSGANPMKMGARAISGKAMRMHSEIRRDPAKHDFDYEKYNFGMIPMFLDKTTLKMDENSKLIVVEGAHGVGKDKFAQELAEELDMKFIPSASVEPMCVNSYGVDLRDYNYAFWESNRMYTERDFFRDPHGGAEGSCDRYHYLMYLQKLYNHFDALRHLMSTGQGVVMVGCPATDYAYFNAAWNQGWILDKQTREKYIVGARLTLHMLLRPNLFIYLDAPVDVVQKKIKARGNEWEQNSPVLSNKQYLSDIYNEIKRNFLKKEMTNSYVLAYDWSEPGDPEIVVEDIEKLNFDDLDVHDKQQADWRWQHETKAANIRFRYSNQLERKLRFDALHDNKVADAKYISICGEEANNICFVLDWIKSERFAPGFNTAMGDSFWKILLNPMNTYRQSMLMSKGSVYYSGKEARNFGPEGF